MKLRESGGRLESNIATKDENRKNMSKSSDESSSPNGGIGPERLEAIRESLRQKRSELVDQQAVQLSALHAPDKHHLADLEEMASDTVDTDSLCALVDINSSTLAEIDTALVKIDEGTYGICELCEKPIHPDRLEVLPFASLCVKCQTSKEARDNHTS